MEHTFHTTEKARTQTLSGTPDSVLQLLCAALVLLVLGVLAASLYTFPIPDSARYWFGDESWLMLEARTQILEGVLRHPYAYGATIYHFVGIMGSSWLSSLFYGLPAAIFSREFPIILIGRTVTFIFAILACAALYKMLARMTGRSWFALFGVLLLLTTPAFAIASHSARPDLLVGFVVLLTVGYFAKRVDVQYDRISQWIAFGAIMAILGLTIALHLVTLLAPFALFIIWQKGGLKKPKFVLSAFLGVLIVVGVLTLVYYLTTGDLSFYGTHGQHVQFMDVTKQKPILRPFSRSVQWNNLTQRIVLLWDGAPALLILFSITMLKVMFDVIARRATYFQNPELRFTALATLVVFLSWLLFQTSIEYYIPHYLLLLCYATALFFDCAVLRDPNLTRFRVLLGLALLVTIGALSIWRVGKLKKDDETGSLLVAENHRAEAKLFQSIKADLHDGPTPLVLAESPCATYIETETNFRIMGPFFSAFPEHDESDSATIKRYGVRYALLFDTKLAKGNGASHDSLLQAIQKNGTLIDTAIGTLFDMGRPYGNPDLSTKDTLKLFRINYP